MTCSIRSKPMAGVGRVAPIVLAVGLTVALAGCNTTQPAQPTQMSAALAVAAAGAGSDRRTALAWAERYRANPNDPEAVVNYARALRAYGERAQAVAVRSAHATAVRRSAPAPAAATASAAVICVGCVGCVVLHPASTSASAPASTTGATRSAPAIGLERIEQVIDGPCQASQTGSGNKALTLTRG